MEAFIAGAWRSPGRGEIFIGGQWRRVTRAEGYIDGQWRTLAIFVQPLSVSVSPSAASGFASPFKPTVQVITTNSVTATPSGGLAPYTYLWTDGNTPTSATTSFRRVVPADSEIFDTADLTVTDALGSTATASVDLTFVNQSQI